jgi:subtilisin family serine protease
LALIVPPQLPVEPLKAAPRAPAEGSALGGVGNLKGRGVTIAIIDTGIDFRHRDFTAMVNGQRQSRIKFFWDTTAAYSKESKFGSPGPCNDPIGAPVGTLFTQAELTQNLDPQSSQIPEGDADGHGTACASIAAGNGSASKGQHQGVAPEADLIAVRIARNASLENVYLLGAICDWLDRVAGDRLVVSCSFGARFGGHDGSSIMERELDARFPLSKQGRALCVAADNLGVTRFHVGFDFGAKPSVLAWDVDPTRPAPPVQAPTTIQIWVATDKINDLTVVPAEGTHVNVLDRFVHPLSKATCIELQALSGSGSVQLVTVSGKPYSADAYVILGPALLNPATVENTISSPGTATNAITVGSYNFNDEFDLAGVGRNALKDPVTGQAVIIGALSAYSSIGYRRGDDNGTVVKPDFAAPGQWFTAAARASLDPQVKLDSTGFYRAFSGTSAAAPYTAGVVALMLEAKPSLTFGEIKKALHASVSPPPQPDKKCPNPKWGYGKLDLAAVEKVLGQRKNEQPATSPKTQ